MIFETQEQVNMYLANGGQKDVLSIPNVCNIGIQHYDTGEYISERKEPLSYMGRKMIVSEYGKVIDSITFEQIHPVLASINNKKEWAIQFKNSSGRTVYKRLIHIIALAFLKDKTPKKIKKLVEHIDLNCLSNIQTDFNKLKEKQKISRIITPFSDRLEWEAFCFHNNLATLDDVMSFFSITDEEFSKLNPNKYAISPEDHDLQYKIIDIGGTTLKIDVIGRVFKGKIVNSVETWVNIASAAFDRGTLSIRLYCEDGETRYLTVSNLMAKAFYGLESRKHIKHVDGIAANLYLPNLWWRGCGFPYGVVND